MQCLVGSHLDKISDLQSGWKLKFGKAEVVADPPERIHLTRHKHQARAPHGFTQYCRKHLRGRVVAVEQPGFDRIVVFELDSGQRLVFEMFAKGNAVLVGAGGKTEKAFRDEEWKDRVIRRGAEYSLPKSGRLDPREMTEKEFAELFGERDVIRSLAAGVNMSGATLEGACRRAGVDKESMEPGEKLFAEIKKVVGEPREGFGAELDDRYAVSEADTAVSDKVARKLAQQEKAVRELEQKAVEMRERGDAVYAHWQELEGLVKTVQEMRDKGASYDDINKTLAGKASINKKTHKMSVKL